MRKFAFLSLALGAVLIFNACSKRGEVVAEVDGSKIYSSQLDKEVSIVKKQFEDNGMKFTPENEYMVKYQVLQELILSELVLAQEKNLDKSQVSAQVEKEYQDTVKQFPSEKEFKDMLKTFNATEDKLKDDIRKQVILKSLIEKNAANVPAVTKDEVSKVYDEFLKSQATVEYVRFRHVLKLVPQGSTAEVDAAKKKETEDLLAQVKGGKSFAEVAQAGSDDTASKAQGGELPLFTKEMLVPKMAEVAFTQPKGQLSGVFKTDYGYHFIEVLDRDKGAKFNPDYIKKMISESLQERKKMEAAQSVLRNLREKANVKILLKTPENPEVAAGSPVPPVEPLTTPKGEQAKVAAETQQASTPAEKK